MLQVFPVGYALMSRKTEAAYASVLKTLFENFLPSSNLMSDLETALQNVLKHIFPDATVNGCFFHHCHVRNTHNSTVV